MADPAAAPMTIDFLRARLLSERSVSRASKERADQLAARVAELEEQVRAVTAQRRQAEREAAEVLAVLESQGFCASLDSGSDNDDANADEEQDDEPRHAVVTRSHGEEGQEQEQPPAKAEAEKKEDDALSGTAAQQGQPSGLSWKGRCAIPRKARQLRQRHRRSYVYILASEPDPSPKYRLGQSCRKNKRKELSSVAALTESRKEQRDGPRCADDGRTEFDGEAGGDDQRNSRDGGQYVVSYDNDGEMARVLEKQAELIGQHEAQEKAQTDWERQFNSNRTSPANKGDVVEADCQVLQDESRGENSNGSSSRHTNSVSSAIKAPSESSPSISKASDWSSSRFHDHADDADDTRSCRRWRGDVADVESVLQALQRARISLRQKVDRPLPPSEVTLALPAPGDEYRGNEDDVCSNGNSSYRGSTPCRQEMLALPAPEDYHDHEQGSAYFSADGANTLLTEMPSGSSRPRQEILALPAPADDRAPGGMKIPVSSPGLFRLPTDSFPEDETLPRSNFHDMELRLREADQDDAYRDDGSGVSAKRLYDLHSTSGRCNVPPGSGASFLSGGIPGLPEDLRKGGGPLGEADLLMQRGCDYSISNRWMSL